ncbi:hypothetical protein [Emcibacter sp. SYSU 3D8]|uniref:SH3 domain-containing protein n=1 Tax=Emcibacter sp. SYSU 3D8 TaxID=3133969 RepID=UPI0031FE4E13
MLKKILAGTVIAAGALAAATSAQAAAGFTTNSIELRSGPGAGYPSVGIIETNSAVEVNGCLQSWSWCDVTIGDNRGWVEGNALALEYQNNRTALVEVAPQANVGVVTFSLDDYWDTNYKTRTFYKERPRWQQYYRETYRPLPN